MKLLDKDIVEPRPGILEFTVEVRSMVKVTLDGAKFDRDFMVVFCTLLFPLYTLADHAKHIAQLAAGGALNEHFTEGYGPLKEMGIAAEVQWVETDVVQA